MTPALFLFGISLFGIAVLIGFVLWAVYENGNQVYAAVDCGEFSNSLPTDPRVSIEGLSPDPIVFSPEFLFPPTHTNQIKMIFDTKKHTDVLKILSNATEGKINDFNFPFQTINAEEDMMPLLFDIHIEYNDDNGRRQLFKLENASIATMFTGNNKNGFDTIVIFDFATIYKKN